LTPRAPRGTRGTRRSGLTTSISFEKERMMSRNRIAILSVVLIGAAALVLVTDEPGNAQMTPGMPKMVTFVLEGNYRVKYSCAFMDKSAEGVSP
jgi:hypothetical protein